jgi:hypothetical protein
VGARGAVGFECKLDVLRVVFWLWWLVGVLSINEALEIQAVVSRRVFYQMQVHHTVSRRTKLI